MVRTFEDTFAGKGYRKGERNSLGSDLFDFRHKEVREYKSGVEIGEGIALGYVLKYGKEKVKEAFNNLHTALEMRPDEKILKLFEELKKRKGINDGMKGFVAGLKKHGVEIGPGSEETAEFMFKCLYSLDVPAIA